MWTRLRRKSSEKSGVGTGPSQSRRTGNLRINTGAARSACWICGHYGHQHRRAAKWMWITF